MKENTKFKPDTIIISQLQSTIEAKNLETIEKLTSAGRVEYLPYLINLAGTTESDSVRAAIYTLLNQLKDKRAVTYLADAISDKKLNSVRKKLVEACWQNGLNFAPFLPLFIDLLIHETDEIAFEAFTLIENMEYMPGDSVLKAEIQKLQLHIDSAGNTRQYFLREAIQILSAVLTQEN